MSRPFQFMLIAGEPSGELLAAELVGALRAELAAQGAPPARFFGAGGAILRQAGVELPLDLTRFAIIGLADVLKNLWRLRQLLNQAVDLALRERPDFIVCVDYGGFNRRFAAALRAREPRDWHPRLIQYVSPQVWASRPGRARTLERDLDLLISILPHEKPWYATRHPKLRVEFVGHPIIDRHPEAAGTCPGSAAPEAGIAAEAGTAGDARPRVVLLPGSRSSEISRHWPVMSAAAVRIHREHPAAWTAIFPNEVRQAQALRLDDGRAIGLRSQVCGLSAQLRGATLAIASTGTVTLECALWRVPTLALYKASWSTAQIVRRIIQVRHLAMPNLLADAPVMPELLQDDATPEAIAARASELLRDPAARQAMREGLGEVVRRLGPPGAAARAARAILALGPPDRGPA